MRYVTALLLVMLLLAGCWDRQEVNDVAIVDMVGVDQAKSGLRLTVSIVIPERAKSTPSQGAPGGAGMRPTITYSAEGESIMNAQVKIQEKLSRRLFWAHTRVLIVSEAYARGGIRPALDFWSRHREPRLAMQIAITPGKASELLETNPRLERLLSEAIREAINMRLQHVATLKDFLNSLRSEIEEAVAPRVLLLPTKEGKDPQVSGTAVFRDDRLIGYLSDADTRGLLWLRGEMSTGVVTVDLPSGGKISMTLIRARGKVRPDFRTGRLRMIVEVIAEDDVYESNSPVDLGKAETVKVVEDLLRREIEQRIRGLLKRVQQDFQVDIVGFGDAVRRGAPLRWERGLKEQWPKLFPQVPVDLVVSAHVRRTGEHGAPLGTKEKQIKKSAKEVLKPKE